MIPSISLEIMVARFWKKEKVEAIYERICKELHGWDNRYIQRLLHTAVHEFINNHIYDIFKHYNKPVVDLAQIEHIVIELTKQHLPEVFN